MSLHHNTPSIAATDPRGLVVRNVAYLRSSPKQQVQALITRQVLDARGGLSQQWDPRLFELHRSDPAVPPNLSHRHSLGGQLLSSDSVDAGRQFRMFGVAGQVLEQCDARGSWQRVEYDALLRPVAVFEQATGVEVERMSYAGMTSADAARNRCGRLVRHDDPAGTLQFERYDVRGDLTEQTRCFRAQAEVFTTTWQHDALGQVLEQVDAAGNLQQSRYGADGQLTHSTLVFKSGVRKTLVSQRTCNASAQVLSERAGNGVVSVAEYSDSDGRLTRLSACDEGTPGTCLQDLSYTYDRVGNVLSISDAAQPTRWASNTKVEAVCTFEYDSLSRLLKATGRENASNASTSALPARVTFGATDDNLWRNYTRHYQYDPAGNLMQMRHVPSSGSGFTQQMSVGKHSNHSVVTQQGTAAPGLGSGFDAAGNLQALAGGQVMSWNARNQLAHVAQVLRDNGEHDDESYIYDGAGQRVIKRRVAHAKAQVHTHEVFYLPGLELHRHGTTGEWLNVVLAQAGRSTVRGLQWQQGRPPAIVDEHLRFSLSDHLGSSTLELDEEAGLLSQESYFPFGATAWWAAKNALEANYKSIRYSGKERDATGLYYYGFRYYAPWLMRWISPDPAGDVDGLNLYAMVGNNPIGYGDADGLQRGSRTEQILVATLLVVLAMLVHAYMAPGWLSQVFLASLTLGAVAVVAPGFRLLAQQPQRATREAHMRRYARNQMAPYGGTEDEIATLAAFFQHQLNASAPYALLQFGAIESQRGGVYGVVGPEENAARAQEAVRLESNPQFTLADLGYAEIEVRPPMRRGGAGPLPAAGMTHTEVQPLTHTAGIRRRASASGPAAAQAVAPPVQGAELPNERLVIDVTDIARELNGPDSEVITRVINELADRPMLFRRAHSVRGMQNTRSFDLPGYRGQGGRGAYRLLVRHVGGLNYRAVGVVDLHR